MSPPEWYRWDQRTLLLDVRIQPRASHNEFAGLLGNRLKIRLTAPPVDGKANQSLLRFLAKSFGVSLSQVKLVSGSSNRDKCVRIDAPRCFPDNVQIEEM